MIPQDIIQLIDDYTKDSDDVAEIEASEIIKNICQQCIDKKLGIDVLYSNIVQKYASIPDDIPHELRMQLNILLAFSMRHIEKHI